MESDKFRRARFDSHVMTDNPYQSPQFQGETTVAESALRRRARLSFRVSVLVLLLPAVYNNWAFNARARSLPPDDFVSLYRPIDVLGFVIGVALIWFLGVPSLEAIARLLRVVFASGTDRNAWQDILYRSLNSLIHVAVPGAALWIIWVFGFYQMHSDFYTISWAVGAPAHLLAACWYVPLIHRSYRLARAGRG